MRSGNILWCPAGPGCPPLTTREPRLAATAKLITQGLKWDPDITALYLWDLPIFPWTRGQVFKSQDDDILIKLKKKKKNWFHFARQTANKTRSFLVTTHTAINLSLGRLFPERCEIRPPWRAMGTENPHPEDTCHPKTGKQSNLEHRKYTAN